MKKPTIKSITLDYEDVKARATEKFADVFALDYLEKPKIVFQTYLKPNGKTTKHSIVLSASYGYKSGKSYKPLRYITGLYASPELYDYDNFTVKNPDGKITTDGHLIKAQLIQLMNQCKQLIKAYYLSNNETVPSPRYLKPLLDGVNTRKDLRQVKSADDVKPEVVQVKFYEFIEAEIKEEKVTNRKTKPESLKQYSSLLKFLKLFIDKKRKALPQYDLYSGDLNEDTIKEFVTFSTTYKGQSDGNMDKIIKGLKKYLRRIRRKYKLINLEFEDWECLVRSDKQNASDSIALTIDELEKIAKLDLSKKSNYMKWSRDIFIAACYTGGPRISDYDKLRFKKDRSTNRYYFEYWSEKQKQYAKVPVFRTVEKIYNDYGQRFPTVIPKTLNENLEKICKLAGLEDLENVSKYVARKEVKSVEPRYKLVSSHTARRTYASIMVNEFGMNPLLVMELTGHDDPAVFMRYCKANFDKLYKDTSKMLDNFNL